MDSRTEAINYHTLIHALQDQQKVEILVNQIEKEISLAEPFLDHIGLYAEATSLSPNKLSESLFWVRAQYAKLTLHDMVISTKDPLYPQALRQLEEPPRFLYLRGNPDWLKKASLAIVGTRTASVEGIETAKKSVHALVEHPVVIASGMAVGIEGTALLSAAAMKVPALAVLQTSLVQPVQSNRLALYNKILSNGAVVTQIPPTVEPKAWHVLLKGQLMNALCRATLVVEDRDGGTAVGQAEHAAHIGRQVALFQHALDNRSLSWPRRLSLLPHTVVIKRAEELYKTLFISSKEQLPLFD
ncbi:MAG: DNA-processing protein DprA [Sphaerochaetaceae bacterium]